MRRKLKWVIAVLTLLLQVVFSAHGWARWNAAANAPLAVSAGLFAVREMPGGSWSLASLPAAERLQVGFTASRPAKVALLHVRANGAVERLHPVPGEAAPTLDGQTLYSIPSPRDWYDIAAFEPGDRLVLVAARARDESKISAALSGPIAGGDLDRMRAAAGSAASGRVDRLDLPRPDAGIEKVVMEEWSGAGTVWVEWLVQ